MILIQPVQLRLWLNTLKKGDTSTGRLRLHFTKRFVTNKRGLFEKINNNIADCNFEFKFLFVITATFNFIF